MVISVFQDGLNQSSKQPRYHIRVKIFKGFLDHARYTHLVLVVTLVV